MRRQLNGPNEHLVLRRRRRRDGNRTPNARIAVEDDKAITSVEDDGLIDEDLAAARLFDLGEGPGAT